MSFVTYCILDQRLIPQDRHRRGCLTCSKECQKLYRLERLKERRERQCDKCGRPKPKQRAVEAANTVREVSEVMQ